METRTKIRSGGNMEIAKERRLPYSHRTTTTDISTLQRYGHLNFAATEKPPAKRRLLRSLHYHFRTEPVPSSGPHPLEDQTCKSCQPSHLLERNTYPLFLACGLGRFLGLLDFLDLLRPGRLWWLLGCTDRGLVLCRKRTILFHQQLDDLAD